MSDYVLYVNPKASGSKALHFEYAVERPETEYVRAVVEALVNTRTTELKVAIKSMLEAGFDPTAILLDLPDGEFSHERKCNLFDWALYHSDRPRRMFRAVVDSGVDAMSFVNQLVIRDKGATTVERWAWKLILGQATAAQRLGSHPLESTGLSPSPDIQKILDIREPGLMGSAVHQAIVSGQTSVLPDLLTVLGLPKEDVEPEGSFSIGQAILWRVATGSSRFDWYEFLQVVDDDALLKLVQIPTVAPVRSTNQPLTLLGLALELAQMPAQTPGVVPLTILLDRLDSRLAPLLLELNHVRTPQMTGPVFDRIEQCLYRHSVVEPREQRAGPQDKNLPSHRTPRVRP